MTRQRHARKIATADRVIAKLRSFEIDNPQHAFAARLNYLRKIDPNVLEEIVLTALADKGHIAKRNARYSGDGGIDGRVYCVADAQWVGVQCKRYAGAIHAAHLERFARDLAREGLERGYFVHTGQTPRRTSREGWRRNQPSIEIISGQSLIALLVPEPAQRRGDQTG